MVLPHFVTHTRLDIILSGPGDLSVFSFVMTFIAMSSVISSGSCSLLPRFSTEGILALPSSVNNELRESIKSICFSHVCCHL